MDVTPPPVVVRTNGPDDTRALAAAVAPLCAVGDVILLAGDLGSGKTTFAQGVGSALGVAEPVVSPTFTIVRQYPVPARTDGAIAPPVRQLVHADLYRLTHRHEVEDLGLRELVEEGGVGLVEWGDAAEPVLADDWLRIDLEADADDEEQRRTLRFTAHGGSWPERWAALEAAVAPWVAA